MKSAGKARNNGIYRHIRTSKEIIRNLLNDSYKYTKLPPRITPMNNVIKINIFISLSHSIAHTKNIINEL